MKRDQHSERGFALLGVLWIIVGLSVLALMMGRISHHAVEVAEMTHDQIAGRWLAEGCLARLRSIANRALAHDPQQAGTIWRDFDRYIVDSAAAIAGCELSLRTGGRVVINRASVAELDSLPGMPSEAVARVIQMQRSGIPVTDLLVIEGSLSPSAKAIFDSHYTDLLRKITVEPDTWIVRAQAHIGIPPAPVNIEVHFVRAGSRTAITRWVEW